MIKKRLKSFYFAFQGLKFLLFSQFHAKIHFFFTIIVALCGLYFRISQTEWFILLFCIGWVWCLEAVNTAIEQILNFVSPEYHENTKNAKDLGAAAVLIAAIFSAIIGTWIFIPYLLSSFHDKF